MGKKGNKRKRLYSKQLPQETSEKEPREPPALKKNPSLLPPPFPVTMMSSLQRNSFLRNNDPNVKDMYQLALDTAFEGFACDIPPQASSYFNECEIQKAFAALHKYHWFRTDITQPYGLGSPCAKTYVTRCLLGEPGSTYKYLGLRMFAHSWNDSDSPGVNDNATPKELIQAVNIISQLNQQLTVRTQVHLSNLQQKRLRRCRINDSSRSASNLVKGRAKFDITLINRMTETPELKKDPITGKGRCAVSWHADSTLEHYSTIAVYQSIIQSSSVPKKSQNSDQWSLALRVAHHSEGPSANKASDETVEAPNLSVTLPSGSAYYLLDDFNHHHQHAVILNGDQKNNGLTAGIRYASTHRLLREGHNVNHLLERCKNTVAKFHKKGVKLWRSEQLLLNEIESEWIRQFYIQGQGHQTNLWSCWRPFIHQLLDYWTKLETRTKLTIDLLFLAAEARCGVQSQDSAMFKSHKKLHDKRKKALASMEDMIQRGESNTVSQLYDTMIHCLEERATMRQLWIHRESDPIFRRMDDEYLPLPVPFLFHDIQQDEKTSVHVDTVYGTSPMIGSPNDLKALCKDLEKARGAYISCNVFDLPHGKDGGS